MRLDQFLKWSRVIPRRTMANATCDAGRVTVNGQAGRPGRVLKPGDVVTVLLPHRELKFRVRSIPDRAPAKSEAGELIEILENNRRETEV